MIEVNNGARPIVSFGRFTGVAGVVTTGSLSKVAMWGAYRDFKDVASGVVDGVPVAVISVERSSPRLGGVEGMVVLTVSSVTAG